jgi:dUTP pyrophosphatase
MLTLEHFGTGEIFYATKESAGFDICANEDVCILPQQWLLVKTGLRLIESCGVQKMLFGTKTYMGVPELQIRPRSGLAVRYGITILNAPSTIDADYRGEIMIPLINFSQKNFDIKSGDRIAQAVCTCAVQLSCVPVKDIERGMGGFGSTGASSLIRSRNVIHDK